MKPLWRWIVVLALMLSGLLIAGPALADDAGSKDDPIGITSPDDLPEGATQAADPVDNDDCSTSTLYVVPGSDGSEAVTHTEYRWSVYVRQVIPGEHHDAVPPTVVHHPAETHVVHHDAVTHEVTVVDEEAVPEVWANFSPNHQQGPFTGPPSYPNDSHGTWHVHDQIPPGHAGPDGVYDRASDHNGRSDWFYRQNARDAVTHTETVVDREAYDETVVDREAYDEVTDPGHDAYTDPDTLSPWAWDHFTEWSTSDETPADPDGESGEDNLANLVQIGEQYTREVVDSEAVPGTDAVYYLLTEGGPCPTEPPVVEPPVEQPPVADGPPVCDPTVVTRSLADAAADCGKDDDTPVVDTPTTVQRKAPPSTHLTALPHTGGSPTVLPMAPVQPSWALYAGLGMLLAGAAYATSLIVRRNRA